MVTKIKVVMLKQNNKGFTLIEMIVSLAVFAVVVTVAVGAMLVLINTNQQLQAEQSVMTNLSFALDTMTREIRTGYNYYCWSNPNNNNNGQGAIFNGANLTAHEALGASVNDCASAGNHAFQGVSFFEGGNSLTGSGGERRVMYFYNGSEKTIMRRVGNQSPQSIVSSGLVITNAKFYVTGSTNLIPGGNTEQPTVTIYIEAQEKVDPTGKTYYLQTTVTQRTLDL
jgi:prepilin-type N-terminal cleavage/methylation domain-containing protein